jgi:hypothetical protein
VNRMAEFTVMTHGCLRTVCCALNYGSDEVTWVPPTSPRPIGRGIEYVTMEVNMSEPTHLQSVDRGSWRNVEQKAGAAPDVSGPAGSPPAVTQRDRAASKTRPGHSLPTDRMKFENQVETLTMFAQLSGPKKSSVGAEDLGKTLGMSPATAGLCSGFFRDSGWVTKTGRGAYAATDALLNYNRHLKVDPGDTAGALLNLAETARGSWYWQTVEPLLHGTARQSVLLQSLSKASGAYDHTPQLLLILDWLEWLTLIRRDGDMVHAGQVSAAPPLASSEWEVEVVSDGVAAFDGDIDPVSDAPSLPAVPLSANSAPVVPTVATDDAVASLISFNLSVRITAEDAARLTPEQITSLLEVVDKLRG